MMITLYRAESYYECNEEDIKIVNYGEKWLVYNSISYGWCIVDEDELKKIFQPSDNSLEWNKKMYEAGILKCNRQYISVKDTKKDDIITYFEVNITNVCNLKCKYCVSNFNYCNRNISMDKKTAQNVVKKIYRYTKENKIDSVCIELSGGEPLLNFDIVKEIVDFFKKVNLKVIFVIQTNGTLLDKEKIDYIRRNKNIQVAISIDGITEEQNSNRIDKKNKTILKKIMTNIKTLNEQGIKYSIVMVVNQKNVNNIEEIIDFFCGKKLTDAFSLLPLLPFGMALQNEITIDVKDYIDAIISLNENYLMKVYQNEDKKIVERNFSMISNYITSNNRNFICNQSPCGAARKIVSIGPAGDVYPCYGFQDNEEFLLGNLNSEFELEQIKKSEILKKLYRRKVDEMKVCKECEYNIWCNGGCTSNAYLKDKNFMQKDDIYCSIYRAIIEKILFEYVENEDKQKLIRNIGCKWEGK